MSLSRSGMTSVGVLLLVMLAAACSKDPAATARSTSRAATGTSRRKNIARRRFEYRNAIAAHPSSGEARLKLADSYMELGDQRNAYGEYIRAADLLPNDINAQLKAAHTLMRAQNFKDAQGRADKAIALDNKNVEALLLRGSALAGLKDIDGAIAQVESAVAADPAQGDSYANLGMLQMAKGDAALAEKTFKQAVESDPSNISARLTLATFYLSTNKRAEAEENIKAAVAIDPKSLQANRALATLYMMTNRRAEVEGPMKVIADNSPTATGRLGLADYYVTVGRPEDAKKIFTDVQKDPKLFVAATLRLAALAITSGNRPEAERLLDQALEKEPKHAEALSTKATYQLQDRKLDAAMATADAAIKADPRTAGRAHLVQAQVRHLKGQLPEATTSRPGGGQAGPAAGGGAPRARAAVPDAEQVR